jgi:hypothetical protein
MRRTKMVLAVAGLMIAMLVVLAAPAMANDNDRDNNHKNNDKNNHHNRFFDHDDDDDDDVRFVFRDDFFDDDFRNRRFDFDFDSDLDQDADSGDVDQSFMVTNTGDNSNQCANVQGVANTGNAQNQLGFTQFGQEDDFDDFRRDGFFFDNDRFDRFDREAGDVEFEDVGSTIEVTPEASTTCDQQVNQAASAFGS